jgi:hypothetical protein
MPMGLVGGLVGGLAGLLGGGKQNTTNVNNTTTQSGTQTQSGTSSGQSNTTGTSTPNLSPIQQQLISMFVPTAQSEINQANNTPNLQQTGLQAINQTNAAQTQAIKNGLASRGLSYSPMAANAQVQQGLNVGNQQNQFLAQLPLLQQQMKQQALSSVVGASQAVPFGSTQTGQTAQSAASNTSGTTNSTSNTQGTVATSGNPAAGAASGFGSGLFGGLSLSNILGSFGNNNQTNPLGTSTGSVD